MSSENPYVSIVEGRPVFRPVTTEEDAVRYMSDLLTQVEMARAKVEEIGQTPGPPEFKVLMLQKAATHWSIRYGQALGALTTLMHARLLQDVAYNQFNARLVATARETVTGAVHG
jgi:hypothetical protein